LCGVPGANYNALMDIAVDQYGYVTTEDAAAVGVVADRLRTMAKRGLLERIAYGLYRVDAVPVTGLEQYMEATLWPRGGGVLSTTQPWTSTTCATSTRRRSTSRSARTCASHGRSLRTVRGLGRRRRS
jgi:hypothetical protein